MQLVAYGAQDVYLTGDPQITFWKVAYKRHTNFSMESVEQTFNGVADFGRKVTCTLQRNGDLAHRMYLQVTLPAVQCLSTTSGCFRWVNYVGHALIKSVEVSIGGQRIDKHYGDWLNIWNELTQKPGLRAGYDNMVGNTIHLTGTGLSNTEATTLYVPLQFWFCRNPGLALPLIALQYHEVRVDVEFRNKNECYVSTQSVGNCGLTVSGDSTFCVPSLDYAALYVDYVYLDTDERRRFAQTTHEYLIEQLQFTGDETVTSTNVKLKLNFNHPVKELVWVCQKDDVITVSGSDGATVHRNQWSNYTDAADSDISWVLSTDGDHELLHSNVEAGWAVNNFPANTSSNAGPAQLFPTNAQLTGNLGLGGITGTSFGPANFGPGAQVSPTNFAALTNAGNGADHGGLGPLNAGRNPVVYAKLQLNSQDRFSERLGSYFNLVQPYQHHTNVPSTGINVYSFALHPEDHQPSGSCNFSRIDNAVLQLQLTTRAVASTITSGQGTGTASCRVRVYAVSYNILRVMSGMAGVAYSS